MTPDILDFMQQPRSRCHVYRLPQKLTEGYCFNGGHPIAFQNVDWFDAPIADGQSVLAEFIKRKAYYHPRARYLVLADHPSLTFVIEPETAQPHSRDEPASPLNQENDRG